MNRKRLATILLSLPLSLSGCERSENNTVASPETLPAQQDLTPASVSSETPASLSTEPTAKVPQADKVTQANRVDATTTLPSEDGVKRSPNGDQQEQAEDSSSLGNDLIAAAKTSGAPTNPSEGSPDQGSLQPQTPAPAGVESASPPDTATENGRPKVITPDQKSEASSGTIEPSEIAAPVQPRPGDTGNGPEPGTGAVLQAAAPAENAGSAPKQDDGGFPVVQFDSLNSLILEILKKMPEGGGYSTSATASSNLSKSIDVNAKSGKIKIDAKKAQPSYCSGATYVAFLALIAELQDKYRLEISPEAADALLMKRQADGVGVWGRWNANGPGTAKLFADLGIGTNFTDISAAMPGDFMKIWWNEGIGSTEKGHSVIFLGAGKNSSGEGVVKYWSSNQDEGYSIRETPRSKIVRVLFSRIEDPSRINLVATLPPKDPYLSTLLDRPSSEAEMFELCRVNAGSNSSLLIATVPPRPNDGATTPPMQTPPPVAVPVDTTSPGLTRAFQNIFGGTKYGPFPIEAQIELLRRVQGILRGTGDYPAEPDGLPGRMTSQAVSTWQQRNQLQPTGVVDDAILKAMQLDGLSEADLLSAKQEKPKGAVRPIERDAPAVPR